MTDRENMTCQCCGGDLPDRETWELHRDEAGECTGSIHPSTGRCRAYADDELWEREEVAESEDE